MPSELDKKTSQLPEADPAGSEILFKVVQDGVDKKVTRSATGAGVVQILQSIITLDDSEIKALPTTPISLVGAPGIGKIVVPFACVLTLDNTAAPYGNVDALAQFYITTLLNSVASNAMMWMDGYSSNGILTDQFGPWISFLSQSGQLDSETPNIKLYPWFVYNYAPDFANVPLYLHLANAALGALTGGNAANTLKITVVYTIIDL